MCTVNNLSKISVCSRLKSAEIETIILFASFEEPILEHWNYFIRQNLL